MKKVALITVFTGEEKDVSQEEDCEQIEIEISYGTRRKIKDDSESNKETGEKV